MNYMVWGWLAAVVGFGVLEAVTAGLVSIWFVCGAVAALIAAACVLPFWVQMILFIAVSGAALILTRPLVKKLTAGKIVPTNADRVLGQTGKVTETIDNESAAGAVYVDGKTWTARSADGTVIPAGSRVVVESMEGVKLFVKLSEKTEVVSC
ncbi:NfeD family protein [Dysosmobacter sp. HCP28S3_G4]|uniref:NfeD family protein n=1 Tax=Dysosmobacter sp. HCP28S3_G4 TaxID=3438938 RepID=UPI003F8884F2